MTVEAEGGVGPLTVGRQLRQARERLRLSLKQVTERTKIQPWILETLEADRLHTSMSPIYVKSFLATYARVLRLDPQPLLAELFPAPVQAVPEPAPPAPRVDWAARLSALVEGVREGLGPLVRRAAPVAAALALVIALARLNPFRWLATHAPRQEASVAVVREAAQAPQGVALDLNALQPLELSVIVRRTTWVSVKADGRLLAQHELTTGTEERWTARKRLELIVAKPSHVEVLLNGQSIQAVAMAHRGRLVITHAKIAPLPTSESP